MPQDPPALTLSDIVHGMSPSPVPQPDMEDPHVRSPTPELLEEEQVFNMRKRVLELSSAADVNRELTLREKEMVEMVLRLTNRPNTNTPSIQLLHQADVIASLAEQRDFLIRDAQEQRERWRTERAGWDREAEALIAQAQRNRGRVNEWNSGYGYVKDDAARDHERHYLGLATDNKALRARLHDAQYRLATLESQLTNLRPLLLTQPTITQATFDLEFPHLAQSHMPPSNPPPPNPDLSSSSSNLEPPPSSIHPVLGESVPPTANDMRIGIMPYEEEAKPLTLPRYEQQPQYRRAVYTYPATKKSSKSKGKEKAKLKKTPGKVTTILNDARAEHLLLAARRLGRQRAFVLGGLIQVEKQKSKAEKEERRKMAVAAAAAAVAEEERMREPKNPKRHGVKMGHKDSLGAPGPTITPTGLAGGPGRGLFPVPTLSSLPLLNDAPGTSTFSTFALSPPRPVKPITPIHSPQQLTNPHTPLDSLLSAARSMMGPASPSPSGDEDSNYSGSDNTPGLATNKVSMKRRTRKRKTPESPVPLKKRKVGAGSASTQVQSRAMRERALGGERVRSALDVLADQAAAYSSGKGKGKERQMSMGEGQYTFHSKPQPHRPRTPLAENGTWSSLKPVQWGNEDSSSSPFLEDRMLQEDDDYDGVEDTDLDAGPSSGVSQMGVVIDATTIPQVQTQDTQLLQTSHPPPAPESHPALHQSTPQAPPPPSPHSPVSLAAPLLPLPIPPSQDYDHQEGPSNPSVHRRASTTPTPIFAASISETLQQDELSSTHVRCETAPELCMEGLTTMPDFDLLDGVEDMEMEQAVHRDLTRVGGPGQPSAKRTRSPYVKWSQAEDDKLAQAVATHGQKWDLVQKELPNRGYHQVRQRWLRKLGVFDNKPDLSAYQTGAINFPAGANILSMPAGIPGPSDQPLPQPKLGLAPLSSELGYLRR